MAGPPLCFFQQGCGHRCRIIVLSICLSAVSCQGFCAILLCFSCYNLVHAKLLNKLLAALVLIQCENITIMAHLTGKHHIDVLMPPVDTPMVWNLTNLTIEGNSNNTPFQQLLFGVLQLLEELTLFSFQAPSTNFLWKRLLKTTTFSKLWSFQTSKDMPLPLLLNFLSQHPKFSILTVTVNTYSKTMPMDDIIEKIDLKSLTVISGPPSYIFNVLCSASAAPYLARLSLLLNHLPNKMIFPRFSNALLCVKSWSIWSCTSMPKLPGINPDGQHFFFIIFYNSLNQGIQDHFTRPWLWSGWRWE